MSPLLSLHVCHRLYQQNDSLCPKKEVQGSSTGVPSLADFQFWKMYDISDKCKASALEALPAWILALVACNDSGRGSLQHCPRRHLSHWLTDTCTTRTIQLPASAGLCA